MTLVHLDTRIPIRGISVAGIYTSLHIPQWNLLCDAGIAFRSAMNVDTLLLSHGHADHMGALGAVLGMRGMQKKTLRIIAPAEITGILHSYLSLFDQVQRFPHQAEVVGVAPGEEIAFKPGLSIRCFRTHHPVPSLGYCVVRKVAKLKPEHSSMSQAEIVAAASTGC